MIVPTKGQLRAGWVKYRLHFNFEARTSRQVMTFKDTYFVRLQDPRNPHSAGIGEVNLFQGLSADDTPDFEQKLDAACHGDPMAQDFRALHSSAINFGFESAIANMCQVPSDDEWSRGARPIVINGLVWMGDKNTMARRIGEKLEQGFRCIKLKIGGIDFEEELALLELIRSQFTSEEIELRLDANGAFRPSEALERLKRLAAYDIHSIEQPIRAGQPQEMAKICSCSPIPIALDEELIGVRSTKEKESLLDTIKPQYIILKPALCGGFTESDEWIKTASKRHIKWWATSALESNVGLEAIARWLQGYDNELPQGLGTGLLYANNIASPLHMRGDGLWRDPTVKVDYGAIGFPE